MSKEYKHNDKIGPGGICCPCCSPYPWQGSPKIAKRKINRQHRRQVKQDLRNGIGVPRGY